MDTARDRAASAELLYLSAPACRGARFRSYDRRCVAISKSIAMPDTRVAVIRDHQAMIPDPAPHVPTSEILAKLLENASPEHVTVAWLLGSLRERSFGIFLLLIALLGLLPGVVILAGLVLLIPAFQMMLARPFPVLPGFIASRRLSTRSVARLIYFATPPLKWLERVAYPRWSTPFEMTKRVIGAVVFLLAITLFSPLPFFYMIPSFVIILIAFSFLEKDGVLLSISLVLAILSVVITAATIWATVIGARLLW